MVTNDSYFGGVSLIESRRVHARACVQLSLVYRAWLERNQPLKADIQKLSRWVLNRASGEATEKELKVIAARPGQLTRQDYLDCSWAVEALVVLSWAIGCGELPPPDEQSQMQESVLDAMGFLSTEPKTISPLKRSLTEVLELTTLERLILWRLRDLDHGNRVADMQALASAAGIRIPSRNLVASFDLAYRGQSIALCDQSGLSTFRSITIERYRAGAWLLGVHADFATVPLDT